MEKITEKFTLQLGIEPNISYAQVVPQGKHFILGGMGGSHLAAGLLKVLSPGIDVYVHRSYDLPPFSPDFFKDGVCIASSYSGNTEETVSFYNEAHKNKYPLVVITSGGKLFELAQKNNHPVVLLPKGIQPRDALGYFMRAFIHVLQNENLNNSLREFTSKIQNTSWALGAEDFAQKLKGKIPLVYSSVKNLALAYIWKIKYNETTKIPAFYNVFPELNHNEMTGFDVVPATEKLSENFSAILLMDGADDPRIVKRMNVLRDLYIEKGVLVHEMVLNTESAWHTIAHAVEFAHITSRSLAGIYGVSPDEVPLVEDFKKRIA